MRLTLKIQSCVSVRKPEKASTITNQSAMCLLITKLQKAFRLTLNHFIMDLMEQCLGTGTVTRSQPAWAAKTHSEVLSSPSNGVPAMTLKKCTESSPHQNQKLKIRSGTQPDTKPTIWANSKIDFHSICESSVTMRSENFDMLLRQQILWCWIKTKDMQISWLKWPSKNKSTIASHKQYKEH